MNFKKLELYGFKSFADKTVIEFDNGMTGIVGPNGCGKSNIADSVRWVLGEQSAKLLRGASMKDVIFGGTERRKQMSFCEVSLYFSNDDHEIPLDYKEIVISRKLYRDGTSEYLLNKNVVRLKQIVDILHDIGIGKEGYSIIGQGKVEEILSAKPDDRRAIFEEAAGVAKFKQRKVEAERKLLRTHDYLLRLNDIILELENQLKPLEKQAEAAKKFLQYRDELKHFELNNYIYQHDNVAGAKAKIDDKIRVFTEELTLKNNELEKNNTEYNEYFENSKVIDIILKELHQKELEVSVGLEREKSSQSLLEQRIAHIESQCAEIQFESEQVSAALESVRAALSDASKDK